MRQAKWSEVGEGSRGLLMDSRPLQVLPGLAGELSPAVWQFGSFSWSVLPSQLGASDNTRPRTGVFSKLEWLGQHHRPSLKDHPSQHCALIVDHEPSFAFPIHLASRRPTIP